MSSARSTVDPIIPLDDDLGAQRHQIIDQHEGEAVDVVDDEDSGVAHV